MTELPAFTSRTHDAAGEARLHQDVVFVVPGRLDQLTGGYLFDRHIVEGLRARGRAVRVIELAARDSRADEAALTAVADGTPTVVDGLALANLGEVVVAHARRLRLVALVHGPLAHEAGLSPAAAQRAAEARPRCCYGFAASSVPAGKLPPRSRAMASLPTGSASLRRGRRSRTSIRGRGGARFVRCSAWRTWCRSRVTACLSRR